MLDSENNSPELSGEALKGGERNESTKLFKKFSNRLRNYIRNGYDIVFCIYCNREIV